MVEHADVARSGPGDPSAASTAPSNAPADPAEGALPDELAADELAAGGLTADELTGWRSLMAVGRERFSTGKTWANRTFDKYRHRIVVDTGMRLYERDRDSAGTVVSSAIAFRLFMFFVPMLLFCVGVLGFFASFIETEDVKQAGITGNIAQQMNTALTQPNSTRWLATLFGLIGMITTGRTLSRALTQASCLAWRLPVRPKAPMRVVGAIIGLLISLALITTIVNRIRLSLGLAVAGMSFVAALLIYFVGFLVLTSLLPRKTPDLGALLPGAALMGLTLVGMQAVSQLYLPDKLSRASALYGTIGSAVVTLGWFFIFGRVIVLGMVVNAVVYERFGSITQFVFGLPVLRILPRRWPWLRRRFALDEAADERRIDDEATDESANGARVAPAPVPVVAGAALPPPGAPSEVPSGS